jgi:hypothetical protein
MPSANCNPSATQKNFRTVPVKKRLDKKYSRSSNGTQNSLKKIITILQKMVCL